jgi:hypothetical protein
MGAVAAFGAVTLGTATSGSFASGGLLHELQPSKARAATDNAAAAPTRAGLVDRREPTRDRFDMSFTSTV